MFKFVYFAHLCIKASLYSSDNQCPFSTDHGPALLSEADCICVAHILVGQSHSHGTACISSKKKKKNQLKRLECHKKYFHLKKKKKKSTNRKFFAPSPSTVPWQGPAGHCWTYHVWRRACSLQATLARNSRTLISSKMNLLIYCLVS